MFAKRAAAEEAVFVAGFVWTLKNHPLSRAGIVVIHKQTNNKKNMVMDHLLATLG